MRLRTSCAVLFVLASGVAAGAAQDPLGCRRVVGRESVRFLAKAVSILRQCAERRLVTPAIVCPEPLDASRLARARERLRRVMAGACAGSLPPELAADCPAPCARPVPDIAALAECMLCQGETAATDFVVRAYPGLDPSCGDGRLGGTEECDPPSDAACPGRCAAPDSATPCQCLPPASCAAVPPPPGSCLADAGCPAGYACTGGQCQAGACVVRADCPAGGQCVHTGSAPDGTCVCGGCAGRDCVLGCTEGGLVTGCLCTSLDDCPPEDDVCFQGVCS